MRIGIFTDAYYPQISGVVTSVVTLREELIKLGYQVYIITVSAPHSYNNKNEDDVIRVPSIPFRKWKELRIASPISPKLSKKIKKLNLDIIHCQTEFGVGIMAKHFAKKYKIPIVHTYHTMYEDYVHYIYALELGRGNLKKIVQKISSKFINSCDAAIAPSEKTRKALLSYGVKKDIYVLPTGIDINHFDLIDKNDEKIIEIKKKYKIDENTKVLLSLGRVSEEKNQEFILRAFPKILEKNNNLKLLIVGDGPYRKKLIKIAKEIKLTDEVIFVGSIPFSEVPYYYSVSDIFVNASKTETQGLTIMEAMATGIPVVIYNDENISGYIKDGESARLFISEDEFIYKVNSALADEEKNKKMLENAKKVVKSLSKENFAIKASEIYEKIIVEKTLK